MTSVKTFITLLHACFLAQREVRGNATLWQVLVHAVIASNFFSCTFLPQQFAHALAHQWLMLMHTTIFSSLAYDRAHTC